MAGEGNRWKGKERTNQFFVIHVVGEGKITSQKGREIMESDIN